ncbi:hypothetical protein AB8B23_10265 [Leptotrichia sp. HSP-342]|uniref:Uncharacterized protein n=1 Tax=Leptotrichia mesophila TaxID=3239303 RepID=A0AB39VB67_9FUSO
MKKEKVVLVCNTYHVYGTRYDTNHVLIEPEIINSILLSFLCRYCGRQVSCHKVGELDNKGCEDKIIQFRYKIQGIQEILETDSKESKQCIQSFKEERLKKLKNLSAIFSRAYDLRTKFFSIFEIKDVAIFSNELRKLIGELKKLEIKECIKLVETL